MEGVSAIYLGKHVDKATFRAFVYSPDGSQKLANSWDEYQKLMESGLWFARKEEAVKPVEPEPDPEILPEPEKKKATKQPKPKAEPVKAPEPVVEHEEQDAPSFGHDDLAFEVKPGQDDFLSDARK